MKQWVLSAVIIAIGATASDAHHSIAAVYDGSRRVTIEGVITQFQFVNPHPFVLVDVTDRSGQSQQWRLELDNRSELAAIGVTADTLKPGDRIVAAGSPARAQAHSLYVYRLDRPADGFRYEQIGFSPRIRILSR